MPSLRTEWACPTPVLPSQSSESKGQERSAQTSKLLHKTSGPLLNSMASGSLSGSMESSSKASGFSISSPFGIMPHCTRLLSTNGLNKDLFLPSKMANQRLTNPSTSKGRRRWRMIKTARSYPSGCIAWYSGWIIRWSPVNNHSQEGRLGSERRKMMSVKYCIHESLNLHLLNL